MKLGAMIESLMDAVHRSSEDIEVKVLFMDETGEPVTRELAIALVETDGGDDEILIMEESMGQDILEDLEEDGFQLKMDLDKESHN